MKGIVWKSTGSWYNVKTEDGKVYQSRTRGKLRLKGLKTTNPIAVGDEVELTITSDNEATITDILPRKNYIIRESIKKSSQGHIIAANVDQTLLVATLKQPRTSLGFIDRFLVTSEAYGVPQVLVFNKTDLYSDKELKKLNEWRALYENIGVKTTAISALNKAGLDDIKALLKGKITLISGHSGVGKSTLLNELSPEINQVTKEISSFADKGVHSTTFAEMFALNDDSFVIDTPGIKELGLIDIEPNELSGYFPEIHEISEHCKFYNCSHVHEPKCAVIEAVQNGEIAESRYKSYVSMYSGEDNRR